MSAYRLFLTPNTYAMSVHALLEELGVDHELKWVEILTEDPDPEFAAVSPHRRVPALLGPDGPLFETGAIALYLAERHPELGFAPPVGDPRRGPMLQWIHYLASTLQPEVLIQYHAEFYFEDETSRETLRAASRGRLTKVLATIEAALDPGPYFFADQPTVPDFCLAMQTIWPPVFPGSIDDYPKIKRLTKTLTDRPAVRRALVMHSETWAGI